MKAMILAAGRGERLRPFTDKTPKPLIPIAGKPLLAYHLEALAKAGVQEIVINTSYLAEQIEQAFGGGEQFGVKLHYSRESQALETGGGIIKALPLLGDAPFLLVNGDVLTDYPFEKLMTISTDTAHLVMVDNPGHNPQGDFALEAEIVTRSGKPMVTYSGIALCNPHAFQGSFPEKFPLRDVLGPLIEAKQLTGEHYHGLWIDVGAPDRLAQARTAMVENAGQAPI